MRGFILHNVMMRDDGTYASDGFYAGVNPKYCDIFMMHPYRDGAFVYPKKKEAISRAKHLNSRGYNFVVESQRGAKSSHIPDKIYKMVVKRAELTAEIKQINEDLYMWAIERGISTLDVPSVIIKEEEPEATKWFDKVKHLLIQKLMQDENR